MDHFLLSLASPELLSWIGFVGLAVALVAEAGMCIIPARWTSLHREAVFAFAVLAAGSFTVERVGNDAIIAALETRATTAETKLKEVARRDLSSSQRDAVVVAIERFKGQKYTGSVSQGLDDGCSFWKILYGVLDTAKWTYVPLAPTVFRACDPPAGIPIASEPGINILVHREKANEVESAAKSLAAVLTKQGVKATVVASPYATTNPDEQATLAIVIGARVPAR